MVLIFHFRGELLGIKSRRELKENAIVTLFCHASLPPKNQTTRQIIEDAVFQAPEEIEETHLVFQRQPPTIWEFVKLIRPLITLLK